MADLWGSGCGMVFAPPDSVQFIRGGVAKMRYLGLPLPLAPPELSTPPSTPPATPPNAPPSTPPATPPNAPVESLMSCLAAGRRTRASYLSRLRVVVVVPGSVALLCYCSSPRTLCLGQVSEQSPACCEDNGGYERFEEWSHAKGRLVHTALQRRDMQQRIEHLDSEVIGGVGYLCVTCTQQLWVYQIPLQESALSCAWLNSPVTHASPGNIAFSKLSPHIAGQVLVLTEQGEVCVYQQEQKTVVMVGCGNGNGGMCLFGAHSQHILWLAEGRLYSCDMCTDKLPLPAMPKAVEGVTEIMCVCKGDRPFHVVVATQRYVHLVDLRQPAEPLLTQLHHLMQPPASVNLLHNVEEATCLILLSSSQGQVVFTYTFISSDSAVLRCSPHAVCDLGDVLRQVKCSELRALCSQEGCRWTQTVMGADFWPMLSADTYAVVMVTAQGDLMYQCWAYSSVGPVCRVGLTAEEYQGLRLWLVEAQAQRKVCQEEPRTTKDFTNVALSLITCSGVPRVQGSSHAQQSKAGNQLGQLKLLYEELTPCSDLDRRIVTEWERCGPEQLFGPEEFSENTPLSE